MKHFWLGFFGYPCLELLWRGRTHPSMALAGGLCCHEMGRIARKRGSLLRKALRSALYVTAVEYLFGITVNRRHQVWDYRKIPGNIRGQVCPHYTLLWLGLSLCAFPLLKRR